MPEAYDKADGVKQDKRLDVVLERSRDVEGEGRPNNVEHEALEKHQTGRAAFKFGAGEKRRNRGYEHIFEYQIEYIQATINAPYEVDEADAEVNKTARLSSTTTGHQRLRED